MTRIVSIDEKKIGPGHPVYIIAEIGYNFSTPAEALASVDAAADCGVDAIKLQTFRAETTASKLSEFPEEAGSGSQFEEFKRYEISEELHRQVFARAKARGIHAFSTPSYYTDLDLLERLGVPVQKVGSDDLTNLPFLKAVAKTGKPIIFSTGMANLSEVCEAYETYRAAGNENLIVMHCVSNYPVRDLSVMNLRVLQTYQRCFGIPVGFSDHTMTLSASLGAVALGANRVERHFTIDKKLPVPDAAFSADPTEMKALVQSIRELESAMGNGLKIPTATEQEMRKETRKSAIALVDIQPGELITPEKFILKRPGTGVPPREVHLLVGRRAKSLIRAEEAIRWEGVE